MFIVKKEDNFYYKDYSYYYYYYLYLNFIKFCSSFDEKHLLIPFKSFT
jgi:hypothetical protein